MKQSQTRWTCPKCGRTFAKQNQQHVCERWTVDDHLKDKPDSVTDLFHRFVALMETCGPFEYSITKANIGFRGPSRIFAGVNLRPDQLRGYMDITYPIDDPRIRQVSPYTKRLFVNHFAITTPEQLDETFGHWLCDSYAVGQGEHLK